MARLERLGFVFLFVLLGTALGQEWAHTWGGSSTDSISAVAVDPASRDVYATGSTSSFGIGSSNVLLLKYSSGGNLLWARTWGGSSSDYGTAVAVDAAGNVYVTGGTSSFGAGWYDVFLLKFTSAGSLLWSKTWGGGSYDVGHDIAVDSSGNVLLAAESYSYVPPNSDYSAAAVLKFTPAGNLLWSRVWCAHDTSPNGAVYDGGYSLDIDGNGNILLSGITWDYTVYPKPQLHIRCEVRRFRKSPVESELGRAERRRGMGDEDRSGRRQW